MSLWSISSVVAFVALSLSFSTASAQWIPTTDGVAVYDATNNLTWVADLNLPASNHFGIPVCDGTNVGVRTCINPSGSMNYGTAAAWVAAMNAGSYLGHDNWQLPTTPPVDNTCGKTGPNGQSFGFGCTAGALDTIYNNLGFRSPNTAVQIPINTAGPFSNVQPYLYWSQSVSAAGISAGNATFSFATGWQGANTLPNFLYLWPMIPGKLPGTPAATGMGLQVNPGGATVYDPLTNITWLANANLAATNAFGLPLCASPTAPSLCVARDGAMTWSSASQYIANMNSAAYLGQTNWQAPTISTTCPGYGCDGTDNPMGNLFYDQLGLVAGAAAVATPNISIGPFKNLQPYLYWSCVGNTIQDACQSAGPAPNFEESYSFGAGFQGTDLLANTLFVTAYFVGAPANLCSYLLSSGGQSFSAAGGTGTITITAPSTCPWTVQGLPGWVTLTSSASGTGNGTVTYQVLSNGGADQAASFTVAGQSFKVEQVAAAGSIAGLTAVGSLAQVNSQGGWGFELDAVNLGGSAATARVNFTDPNGNALPLPLTFPQTSTSASPELAATLDRTINANARIVIDSSGPGSALLLGSGQLLSTGNVSGFGIFSYPAFNWNAVVPLETRKAVTFSLPFDNTGVLTTGVALANVTTSAIRVQVTILSDRGAQIVTDAINFPAEGYQQFMLPAKYPQTLGARGTIQFQTASAGELSVLGVRANGIAALTTLPVLSNVDLPGGSISDLTYGGGFTSTFYLVNTGTSPASFTLGFYNQAGNPVSVPLSLPQTTSTQTTATLTQSLAAGQMLEVATQAAPVTSANVSGSAQLTTTGSISGFEIFDYSPNGQEASVPLETRTPASFVLVYDNTSGLTTGVALANASASAANIAANIYDDQGNLLQTNTIPLAGHAQQTIILNTAYPNTANRRGMVQFAVPASGPVSMIGIRVGTTGATTTTTIPILTK